MARVRMVTRTVTVTTVGVMCLDVTTAEVQITNFEMSGTYADFDSALKAVKKVHETDTFKCVAVQHMTENEVLYGMTELEFIQMAKVLPPRGANSTETDSEE